MLGGKTLKLNELLKKSCDEIGINLDNEKIEKFIKYKDLLLDWNKKINLTAITDEREIILKHFVDSLSVACGINFFDGINIIDVGTGAGFPGIPVKVFYENSNITLLDSLNKRIQFLEEVVKKLNLKNVICIHSRAEDAGQSEIYREMYDLCVSRALADLSVLCEYCLPFVKVDGIFVSLKGPDITDELENAKEALNILGGEVVEVKKITIPETEITHSLIIIKKVRHTPTKFPRKSGKIVKSPIK